MSRYLTRGLQVVIDLAVLSIAYWMAYLFRFEFQIPRIWLETALLNWPYTVALFYLGLAAFGVPRFSWRYVSMTEMLRIGGSVFASTVVMVGLRLGFDAASLQINIFITPFSVCAMTGVLGFGLLVGARTTRRIWGEARERKRRAVDGELHRVLLVGAGQAGVMVARELVNNPDLGLKAVGFLDNNPMKVGSHIAGLPVLGTTAQVKAIAEKKRVKRILITIANAPGHEIRRITMQCKDAGLDTKIIPGLYEIVGDRINLSRIRDVAIEDLLGREQVQLDDQQVSTSVTRRCVLVTGAGGSIGSEICRQVARLSPARLVLVERFENALFEIHRELTAAFPDLVLDPRIADVTDETRLRAVFASTRPHVVFHAAAHKHVPMMEINAGEAVKNNIGGTRTVAKIADEHGVDQFVLVSTDKAVNPSSVMGATKRVAELVCQAFAQRSKTRFVVVRFGNVLGSNGSVIPIFKEQIARGGPITVTHPDMQRYFMTIPEAAQLVIQAGAMGQGGEVFILDMGRPVKIVDLAKDLIKLSGFDDDVIEIMFTGVRPGEKLFEELSTSAENADKTKHPKIFIGRVGAHGWDQIEIGIQHTMAATTDDGVREALHKIVPEYRPKSLAPQPNGKSTGEARAVRTTDAHEPVPAPSP